MNKLTVWDDIFNIIPEDPEVLSDSYDWEWVRAIGIKRIPYQIIKSLDEGDFDIKNIRKYLPARCFIGEIYCEFDFVDVDIVNNACKLKVTDDCENEYVYTMSIV